MQAAAQAASPLISSCCIRSAADSERQARLAKVLASFTRAICSKSCGSLAITIQCGCSAPYAGTVCCLFRRSKSSVQACLSITADILDSQLSSGTVVIAVLFIAADGDLWQRGGEGKPAGI